MSSSHRRLDYILFGFLATFWGGSFVAIKFVVQVFPPVFGAILRVATALVILGAIIKLQGRSVQVAPKLRRKMWTAGFFAQGLPFALLFWGERRISPGLAGILNGTVPLWTFILSFFVLHIEKDALSVRKIFGLFLGILGVVIVFWPMIVFHASRSEILGTVAVVLMAVSYAIGALLNRSLLAERGAVDFRANLFHQHCASLAFLISVSVLSERWPALSAFNAPKALIAVFYLGLFSTALAWLIYYHLIREWGAVRASTATYVAPVIALFWDYVFFSNVPTASEVLGVLAILSGVILLQKKHV